MNIGTMNGRKMLWVGLMESLVTTATAGAAELGATKIAPWKDDRRAPFVLMFDDSMPSHLPGPRRAGSRPKANLPREGPHRSAEPRVSNSSNAAGGHRA